MTEEEPEGGTSLRQSMVDGPRVTVDLKTDVAHSARIYDYFLGGKDNFAADREAAAKIQAAFPETPAAAVQNRAFLVRVARFLAGAAGIRQFLDIGTGIPTAPNLHEVVQGIAPESRIVYVDNDPIVLAHARALLTSGPRGRTAYLDADLCEPRRILESPELRETLDLTQPVALSTIAVLHFLPPDRDPFAIVRELLDAFPSGSYLALTYLTADHNPEQVAKLAGVYRAQGIEIMPRSRDEIARFFDGLELVEPGLTSMHLWRPDDDSPVDALAEAGGKAAWCGVARKP